MRDFTTITLTDDQVQMLKTAIVVASCIWHNCTQATDVPAQVERHFNAYLEQGEEVYAMLE